VDISWAHWYCKRIPSVNEGVVTALIAYCIDVWESVFFDWKEGYCASISPLSLIDLANWTLDKKFCCWEVKCICFLEFVLTTAEECTAWRTWSSTLAESIDTRLTTHLIYISFAVLFSLVSACLTLLTKSIYPTPGKPDHPKILYLAAGSGIPEVKTILSGFVIRKFLGLKTLLVKAVGLTLSVASGLSLGKEGISP